MYTRAHTHTHTLPTHTYILIPFHPPPPPPHTHTHTHAQSVLYLHQMEDGSFVMNFPLEMGSITGYSGRRKDTEIFYRFISFLSPGIIYRCDMAQTELKPEVSLWRRASYQGFLFWWGEAGGRPAPESVMKSCVGLCTCKTAMEN